MKYSHNSLLFSEEMGICCKSIVLFIFISLISTAAYSQPAPLTNDASRYAFTHVNKHSFKHPGHYIVSVERTNECGFNISTKLHIEVKN